MLSDNCFAVRVLDCTNVREGWSVEKLLPVLEDTISHHRQFNTAPRALSLLVDPYSSLSQYLSQHLSSPHEAAFCDTS